jgi:crotonobetainyl-CoA:carnitine CoA-transferase CaiB-like acyl-CoA transferase
MDEQGLAPPELKEKDWEKFDQFQATQAEYDQIMGPISRFFLGVTKTDFYREAVRRRIMGYPVSTAKDILEDPQLEARRFWERVEHSEAGEGLAFPGPFAKFSVTPLTFRRRAPLIGEHNEEVYGERLGLSREELTALGGAGVI